MAWSRLLAWWRLCLGLLSVLVCLAPCVNLQPAENINYNLWVFPDIGHFPWIFRLSRLTPPFSTSSVHSWADKLGMELFHLGDFITRRKEVQEVSYREHIIDFSAAPFSPLPRNFPCAPRYLCARVCVCFRFCFCALLVDVSLRLRLRLRIWVKGRPSGNYKNCKAPARWETVRQ